VKQLIMFCKRLVVPRVHSRLPVVSDELDTGSAGQQYHLPLAMVTITAIEVVAFLTEGIMLDQQGKALTIDGPVPICSPLIYLPSRRWEAWRFISYGLVHVGYLHLLSNCLVQLMLGVPLELYYGSARVCGIYVAGVVSGSLATSLTDPQALLAGASGGVYAILLAHLPTLILNWREIDTLMEWTVHGFVLLVGLIDLVVTIITRHTSGEAVTVGYSAHIAGALAGFLVGVNLIRNFRHERWEGILRVVCLMIWTIGVATTILWNSVATPFFPPTDWSRYPGKSCD